MTDPYRALCAELVDAYAWCIDAFMTAPAEEDTLIQRARALLAQPVPEGPTDEEINEWHGQCADLTRLGEADHYWAFDLRSDEVAGVVRAALTRWGRPTPQPVPVSERLPGPEDCEAGECWGWDVAAEAWNRTHYAVCNHYTHWLPANALPTPEATND